MDFSFEKTNSAYMLFYERCPVTSNNVENSECPSTTVESSDSSYSLQSRSPSPVATFELSKELEDWIWQDNMHFIQDKNIFEHTYFKYVLLYYYYFTFIWTKLNWFDVLIFVIGTYFSNSNSTSSKIKLYQLKFTQRKLSFIFLL